MCEDLGPVEGWIVAAGDTVAFVKGCQHPLPRLFVTLRLLHGRKLWTPIPPSSKLSPPYSVEASSCLGGRTVVTVEPSNAKLLSPIEALRRVRSCSRGVCRAALKLVEEISSSAGGCVGVTGGLAYNPKGASDIDVVVYSAKPEKVYRTLVSLRLEGRTSPLRRLGHGWSEHDASLHMALAPRRMLQGVYEGYEYNVKIVACRRPGRCKPTRYLGRATASGILRPLSPFTIPATYKLLIEEYKGPEAAAHRGWLLVYSLRLRYTEIPELRVEVSGGLELWPGNIMVLVPDVEGYIRPLIPPRSLAL